MNGPPGVGKSTVARRLRDDRPLSLLVDFDELWMLIGDWQHHPGSQQLAVAAGLAMARAHLGAGYDVVAPQLTVDPDFFQVIDAMVGETAATCHEIVLTGDPERVAAQFRRRRAERMRAGTEDVSSNISDDRVDEVIRTAAAALHVLARARPHTLVISTDGDVESTHVRVREALRRRGG